MIRLVKIETIDRGTVYLNPWWIEVVAEAPNRGETVTRIYLRPDCSLAREFDVASPMEQVVNLLASSVASGKGLFG